VLCISLRCANRVAIHLDGSPGATGPYLRPRQATIERPDIVDDLDYNLNDELPDGRRVKRFYAVQDMFGSYFHEDWRLDHPSTAAVIRRYAHDYPGRIPKVIAEIDELVALDASDQMLLDHLLHRYSLAYDPASDGLTIRQWLRQVGSILTE
jgi:contact-dependent growth inhibition (CDI) system CdiI-like immunity protein